MLSIDNIRPSTKKILKNIEAFERHCMGESLMSPERFREINMELSVGAVVTIGKYRFRNAGDGKHVFWIGADGEEYDLGYAHDVNVFRDYPGFHGQRSVALAGDKVAESKVIHIAGVKGSVTVVTMLDGSVGVGPNYRMALRNAALKMHLKSYFNRLSLASIWGRIMGHA
tara:strand:+ start:1093 stop:1602 length:510 start_codon:yes stop_codon:yes gene_type:complete